MKHLAPCLCLSLAALAAGCVSPRRESRTALRDAPALWYPAGYERHLVLEPALCPPGSLAEFQLATGLGGETALRAFAAQFPGAETEIAAYHRHWTGVFAREAWPVLHPNARSPRALETLAAQLCPETARANARESLGFLHRALTSTTDPVARERLQPLLAIHEIQQLRAQAILHANLPAHESHSEPLVRTLRENPLPPRFRLWLESQEAAERSQGDLAGRELSRLRETGGLPADIQPGETLVLADPADRGLAGGWQRQWPAGAAGNPLGQPFARWQPDSHADHTPVIWFMTPLVPGAQPPEGLAVNLRGVRGTVRAYVDGVFLGEHDAEATGHNACRLSRSIQLTPGLPVRLVLRIERPAGTPAGPALWHRPWLTAD